MTNMQRYGIHCTDWQFDVLPADDGLYVLAADAEAAIAAADQRGRDACKATHAVMGLKEISRIHEQGQRDTLARCIAAVEALARTPYFCNEQWSGAPTHLDTGEVLAALQALQTP